MSACVSACVCREPGSVEGEAKQRGTVDKVVIFVYARTGVVLRGVWCWGGGEMRLSFLLKKTKHKSSEQEA